MHLPLLQMILWILYIQKIGGAYKLVIEKQADGSEKSYVNLGSSRPFEPLKWTSDGALSGIQLITVVDNNSPTLEVSKSNNLVPISGSPAGQPTAFGAKGSIVKPFISISDSDNDNVFITLTSEGGTLSKNNIGGQAEADRVYC